MCVTHANEAARALSVARVDHAMQGMRRLVTRPPSASVPVPGLGRPVDLSKVLACEALAELSRGGPVTITDLSTAMHLERSTVSRLVGEAEAEGLDVVFKDAGFEWHESGCGMCSADGRTNFSDRRVISTTNRNFEGRQGPRTKTHLASPATVAASSIAGAISDPRKYHQ